MPLYVSNATPAGVSPWPAQRRSGPSNLPAPVRAGGHRLQQQAAAQPAHRKGQGPAGRTGNDIRPRRGMRRDVRSAVGRRVQGLQCQLDREGQRTTMHAFMNGVSDDDVIFSTLPTNRRTLQNPATKDDFPGEHFQRLTNVDPDESTIHGSPLGRYGPGAGCPVFRPALPSQRRTSS